MKRVVVLGGGVAGMSAAHELAERGFAVSVYERRGALGGKARSVPVPRTAVGPRPPLPGEHGFRFFPGFYRHVTDTMKRIPYGANTRGVYDNLVDSTRVDWLFDLAELHLLRLSSRDSAVAQYRRILSDTSSKRPQKARASYALAWIADDAKSDSGGGAREAWLQVARDYPSTEFAKAAQRNAGVPVTERTAADSAEARYRQAEILWMDKGDPKAAAAAFAAMEDRVTEPGKRAYWAVAWIHDNLLHDSAKAAPAYRRVVDSLPGTRWAQRADAILKGQPRDFLEGRTIEHHADDDFVEGTEKLDSTRTKFGPRKPNPSGLLPADVPEPIPPRPEDQFLTPEDFN